MQNSGFVASDFERLGRTTSEAAAINSQAVKIDALITRLNDSMFAGRFLAVRAKMGLTAESLYLTRGDYVHGGDNQHWYIFHRGGRWEPEFNIGMYGTRADRVGFLRIGIGFNLTAASRDPDRLHGQLRVKELFRNFQWVARTQRESVARPLSIGRSLAQCIPASPAAPGSTVDEVAQWIGNPLNPDDIRWFFVGRALSPDVPEEAEVLSDMRVLTAEVGKTFTAWLPAWEAAMRGID